MGSKNKIKALIAGVVASTALVVSSVPAMAHDAVIGSTPADGETITAVPEVIELKFSGLPKDGFNTMALTDESGTTVVTGEPTIEGNIVTLDLGGQDLAEGSYTVGFQITSEDGHSVRGKTTFVLDLPGESGAAVPTAESGTVTASESASSAADMLGDPSSPMWGKTGAVVGLIVILGALAAMWLRRRAQ